MTPRRPSFLAAVPEPEPRPAPFALPPAAPKPYRAAGPARRGAPEPEPAPGPTPEELAALRAEAMEKVGQAVEVLRLQAARLAEQARGDAIELGFQVARRILEAELASSSDALFALVRSALKRAGDSRKISVRIHPDDAPAVESAASGGQLGFAAAQIEVLADPSLLPGDVVVDTDFGKVDGRLRTRLDELNRAVSGAAEEVA